MGKEGDKLEKVVREGQRKVKELGNVQNWAEVLERDFLVVGEVLRLIDGESEESERWSEDGSDSDWSEDGGHGEMDQERDERLNGDGGMARGDIDTHMPDANTSIPDANGPHTNDNGKGKGVEEEGEREIIAQTEVMDTEESSISTNISNSEPSSSSIRTSASGIS